MQHVYLKCTYEIIGMPGFFAKLKDFIGEFRIEQQPIQDIEPGVVTISFSTDLVQIEEGKPRQVELIAENNESGWDFTGISKCY